MAKSKKKTKLSAFSRFSKQQLIIAGIFILGFGGFGVWKLAFSSAASSTVYASNLAFAGGVSYRSSENGIVFIGLRNGGFATTSGNNTYTVVLPSGTRGVRACANVKRTGTASYHLNAYGTNSSLLRTFSSVPATSDYKFLCTGYSNTYGKSNKYKIDVKTINGAEIRVSQISLDYYY